MLGSTLALSGGTETNSLFRKSVTTIVTTALLVSCSASAAMAACGAGGLGGGTGGPPSIAATEASTTQVLDEIRRRQEQAQQGMQVASNETAAGGGGAAASSGGAAPAKPAAAKPVYKPTQTASYQPAQTTSGYGPILPTFGAQEASWGEGYLDYEHHDDIAPGTTANRARKQNTAGYMSGTDWTWTNPAAAHMFQLGFFSGYQASYISLSDTNNQQNSRDKLDGSMLGAYLAGADGKFSYNLAFKTDIFNLDSSTNLTGCGADTTASGDASVTDYTIAGSMSWRHDLGYNRWFEPTAGFQYTITEYGNDAFITNTGNIGRLGLNDGTVLRLLAGARVGQSGLLANGGRLTVVGGAFLYSDVAITGFAFTPTNPAIEDPVLVVDEGKLRVMGQLITNIDYANGWSWWASGEIRGGEDLFGATGRFGGRLNW